jgi:hypothetical protein
VAVFYSKPVLFALIHNSDHNHDFLEGTEMNKLFYLTTLPLAIAALNPLIAQAQQTPARFDNTTIPRATISDRGLCGPGAVSRGVDSDSIYTAGPVASTTSTAGTAFSTAAVETNTSPSAPAALAGSGSYNPNASYIVESKNDTFGLNEVRQSQYIRLYVGGSALCYVNLTPIDGVDSNDHIRVYDDKSDQELGITVTKKDRGAATISFAQPVPPGNTIRIEMRGIRRPYTYNTYQSTFMQYSLSGGQANFTQEVPYGITHVRSYIR